MSHPVDSSHFPQNRWSRRLQSDANVLHMAEVDQQRILQRSVVLPSRAPKHQPGSPPLITSQKLNLFGYFGTAREHNHSLVGLESAPLSKCSAKVQPSRVGQYLMLGCMRTWCHPSMLAGSNHPMTAGS